MVLLGAIVNEIGVIIGALLGTLFRRIPENMKDTVMKVMGLAIIILGIQMSMETNHFVILIFSLAFGAIIGELLSLEDKINQFGSWFEKKIGSKQGNISQGFITGTLIFAIGAMGIVGALDSGLRGNHDVLFTKTIIDTFVALILTTTLGIGVLFSAIPLFLYEGTIALMATQIHHFLPAILLDQLIIEMSATGGVLIMAIGSNLVGITNIKVANLLPSIVVTILLMYLWDLFQGFF